MLASGLVGCSSDFKPTICTAVNFNLLDCVPTDPAEKRFDLKTDDIRFLKMACFFEDDFTEGKKRARKILEGLD